MITTEGRPSHDTSKSGVNYERLGKAVEDALILDYVYILHSTRRQIWSSFMRGFFAGLGGVVGATVGVTALVAVLFALGNSHVPGVSQFFQNLGHTIDQRQ